MIIEYTPFAHGDFRGPGRAITTVNSEAIRALIRPDDNRRIALISSLSRSLIF